VRVVVIVGGSAVLAGNPGAQPAQYFMIIAAGMVAHALVTASAIRLGAWTGGNPQASAAR
jgi:hypothetical protein